MLGGYAFAFGAALVLAYVRVRMTSGPDRDASAGMYAFGDAMWFLFLLGCATIPATGLALYFLRSVRTFWKIFSGVALAVAATAAAATLIFFFGRSESTSLLGKLSSLSVLRILVEPICAVMWTVAAIFAPERPFRLALLGAAAIEAVSVVPAILLWISPFFSGR
ncbi:MAG: hypothetical protein M0D55_04880 [Elusimicrobiota bacterium]|nr:MAG: hypothetical protein M0D55_04880 [Elusimicrobiota bacterium]